MNPEHIALIAQQISFAFEDQYYDEKKRNVFIALFNKYLLSADPTGALEPYEAIIALGRQSLPEFDQMVKEMKDNELISD